MNLPLQYWERATFEAIGEYFGDLNSICSRTLNLIDCEAAYIEFKKNPCGFVPATIEIQDKLRGSTFLRFGDIVAVDSSPIS